MQASLVFLVLILNFNISKCTTEKQKEFIVNDFHLRPIPPLAELALRNFNDTTNLKDNSRCFYFWQSKVHLVVANEYYFEHDESKDLLLITLEWKENTAIADTERSDIPGSAIPNPNPLANFWGELFFKRYRNDYYINKINVINEYEGSYRVYIPELKSVFNLSQLFIYNIDEPNQDGHKPLNICLEEYAKFKSGDDGSSLVRINEYCPNVCNSMPCTSIPNAFEHSCQAAININKLKSGVLGKPTNIQLENLRKKFSHLFEMITLDYECECSENYIWVVNSENNGGSCLPIESSCDSIRCGIGKCILASSDYTNFKIAKCLCPPAFTGKYCELRHDPCLNDRNSCGRFPCVRDSNNLKYGYYCLCDRGYKMVDKHKNGSLVEPHCEDMNECEEINTPCLNNSTCVNLNSESVKFLINSIISIISNYVIT